MSLCNCAKFAGLLRLVEFKLNLLNKINPLVQLIVRLWMADVFWKSVVLKVPTGFLGFGKGNWDSTLYLYEFEHPIPFMSPEFAAYTGTFFEIICPILLVLGLGTRAAAAILLVMTAFIQFTYSQQVIHIHWMVLLAILVAQGGGKLSIDYFIRAKYKLSNIYQKVIDKS